MEQAVFVPVSCCQNNLRVLSFENERSQGRRGLALQESAPFVWSSGPPKSDV